MHTAGHPSAPHPHQETSLLSKGALSPRHGVLAARPGAADHREVSSKDTQESPGHSSHSHRLCPPAWAPWPLGRASWARAPLCWASHCPQGSPAPPGLPPRADLMPALCAGFCCGHPSLPPLPPPQLCCQNPSEQCLREIRLSPAGVLGNAPRNQRK